MKSLLIGLLVLGSVSAFAQSYRAEVSIDWERIERSLTTGNFSCVGTCAKISIDWAEVWQTVNGKNFRDKKKNQVSMCEKFYTSHYERLNQLKNLALSDEISNEFYQARLIDESEIMNESESIMCNGISISKRKNLKLKVLSQIFEF